MKACALILMMMLASACSHANLSKISGNEFSSNCALTDENFNDIESMWLVSDLIDAKQRLVADLNDDGLDDTLALLQSTDELQDLCPSNVSDNILLLSKLSNTPMTIKSKLRLGEISVPTLHKKSNGFTLNYQTGQSVKCDQDIEFAVQDDIWYVDSIRTICFLPNSDIGWQTRSFKGQQVLSEDVSIPSEIASLQVIFFEKLSYTVTEKSYIYSQPMANTKTASYFIAGDEIEGQVTNDNWVEVRYADDTKVGWLPIKNLQRQTASDHLRLWMIRPEPPNTELENNSSK